MQVFPGNYFNTKLRIQYRIGDPAYPIRAHLQRPYKSAVLTPAQQDLNTSMSTVRSSVEWIFGDVNYFKFLDFKKNLKIGLSAVGRMYVTCALMQNAKSILYGSVTSEYFGVSPPTLEEYFTQKVLKYPPPHRHPPPPPPGPFALSILMGAGNMLGSITAIMGNALIVLSHCRSCALQSALRALVCTLAISDLASVWSLNHRLLHTVSPLMSGFIVLLDLP